MNESIISHRKTNREVFARCCCCCCWCWSRATRLTPLAAPCNDTRSRNSSFQLSQQNLWLCLFYFLFHIRACVRGGNLCYFSSIWNWKQIYMFAGGGVGELEINYSAIGERLSQKFPLYIKVKLGVEGVEPQYENLIILNLPYLPLSSYRSLIYEDCSWHTSSSSMYTYHYEFIHTLHGEAHKDEV